MSGTLAGTEPSMDQGGDAEAGVRRTRLREQLDRDWARVLVVVLGWQALLTVSGRLLEEVLPQFAGDTPVVGPTVLSHMLRWDAWYFYWIVEGTAYQDDPANQAFYPLFPLLVWLLRSASLGGLDILAAGLVVNTVATWLAALALLRIGERLLGTRRAAWLLVATFLAAPAAFFLHAFFSEAVFAALGLGAYACALARRWHVMGSLLVLVTAARLPAVLFVGLCFLEFWRSRGWRLRGLVSWPVLWFPASVGGFLGYALHLHVLTGNPWGMFDAYDFNWPYHVFEPNVAATLLEETRVVWEVLAGERAGGHNVLLDHVIPLAGLAALLVSLVHLLVVWRGAGVPLAAFGAAALVMFSLNSNLVSVHRYLLPVVVTNVALVHLAGRGWSGRLVLYGWLFAGAGLQLFLYALFVSGNWAG